MTLLYIVRHAWAEGRDSERFPDDDLRPLTDEGRKRFRRMVRTLLKQGFDPTLLLTSPLVRCRQTAEIIAEAAPRGPAVIERAELAPGGDPAGLLQFTVAQPSGVAWVGHAPDVEELTELLIGGRARVRFAKGAICAIEFPEVLAPGQGVLAWLVTAKVVGE
jgi:phosphohistidine phosphatase